jgi:predicted PurR-regulated permease PerM
MKTRDHHLVFWLMVLALLAIGLSVFRDILLPFVSGIVIAYFLNPIADALQRRGLSRTVAALVIIGLAGIAVVTALILVLPMMMAQAKALSVTLPGGVDRLRASLEAFARERLGGHYPALQAGVERLLADLQSGWANSLGQILPALLSRSFALVNIVSLIFITPLVAFYLLVDWHRMLATVESWLPRDQSGPFRLWPGTSTPLLRRSSVDRAPFASCSAHSTRWD